MNTNPKRYEVIDKIVTLSESERLQLIGYLLAKYPEINDGVLEFNPS